MKKVSDKYFFKFQINFRIKVPKDPSMAIIGLVHNSDALIPGTYCQSINEIKNVNDSLKV